MKLHLIAAMDNNRAIGFENTIPWKISADMQWFKQKTTGGVIVMGRNTFESFNRKCLPNRINVVIGKKTIYHGYDILQYDTLEQFMSHVKGDPRFDEVFIIGGQQLYSSVIEYHSDKIDSIWLTYLEMTLPQSDVWFPTINQDEYDSTMVNSGSDINKVTNDPVQYLILQHKKKH